MARSPLLNKKPPLLTLVIGNQVSLIRAVFDIVSYSNEYYARMRSLPFPTWNVLVDSPDQIAIYLPIGVWAATLVILLRWQGEQVNRSTRTHEASAVRAG